MNNKLIFLFYLSFHSFCIQAQFSESIHFDSIVNLGISLSEKSIYDADFEEAKKYLQLEYFEQFEAYQDKHQLALKTQQFRINSYEKRLQNIKVDPKESLNLLLSFQAIAKNINDKNILGDYYSLLASTYFSNKENDLAIQHFDKALQLFNESRNPYKAAQTRASIISMKQTILQRDNNLQELKGLIWKYDQEIEYTRKHNNKYAQSFNTRHLGQIYLRQIKDYEKTIILFEKSLSLRKEIGFKPYLPASYFSLGEVLEKMGKPDNAVNMYEKSLEIADEIGFVRYQYNARIKIAEIFQTQGSLNKAKEYYVDALKSASSNGYLEGIDEVLQKIEALNDK